MDEKRRLINESVWEARGQGRRRRPEQGRERHGEEQGHKGEIRRRRRQEESEKGEKGEG